MVSAIHVQPHEVAFAFDLGSFTGQQIKWKTGTSLLQQLQEALIEELVDQACDHTVRERLLPVRFKHDKIVRPSHFRLWLNFVDDLVNAGMNPGKHNREP